MDEQKFWSQALGAWIKDCVCGPSTIVPEKSWRQTECVPLRFAELCDGYALNLLFFFIDPSSVDYELINSHNNESSTEKQIDSVQKLKSFHFLIRNLHHFYKDKLNRLITMSSSPDVLCIVKNPVPEVSAHELNKILLLLLGCAVQSEQKEHFINRIRCMRTELQSAIVGEIQKITEDSGHLLEIQSLEILPDDHRFLTVLDYLERIMKERDDYANGILEMAASTQNNRSDLDDYENVSNGTTTSSSSTNGDHCPTTTMINGNGKMYKEVQYVTRSPSPSTQERHGNIEVAELKAQVRRLKYDMEHKEECINICQEELQSRDEEISKLKSERQKLVSDAYAAKDLAEENEHLQEQILGLRKLEVENEQLKSKISQLSFYKNMSSRFEHDNKILQESLQMAEDQLHETKKRLEVVSEMEHKLHDSQLALKAANDEISKERDRIDELLIENGKLRREVKDHSYKRMDLERHLEAMEEFSTPNESFNDSLQSQLDVHNRSAILELKLENQKLQKQLEDSSKPGEMFELKEELAAAERKAEEKLSEIKKLTVELENAQEAKSRAETKLSSIRSEQESLTQTLQETRRQLSAAQADLTVRKEDEILQKRVRELEQTVTTKDESVLTLEEEKKRIETQLEKTKQKQKESRQELDTLKDEYANMETALAAAERSKKTLEAERNTLKARVESLEDKCDQLNVKLVNYENLERRYANNENLLIEKSNKIADLEAENRTTKQQSELEMKKAQRLREDLVTEKCRIGDLLSRLRTVCNAIRSNGGKLSNAEDLMNDDEKLIDIIDDVIMQALNAARREADALRLQQQLQIAELDDLKKDIESLRRAEGELTESDDKVKELIMENKNIKEQVTLLQERLRKLQVEDSAKASELQAIKRDMEEIHNKNTNNSRHSPEIAKLQVQLRNAQLQEELHREDNGNLRKQIENAIKIKTEYEKKLDSLQATQEALIADYNRLENLHHLLGADYDRTKVELLQLKQRIKHERMNGTDVVSREKMHIEATLRGEREESQKILREAEMEIARLQKELSDYRRENSAMLRNTDERSDELRRLRVAECSQKSTINSLNGTIQQLNHVLSGKEMEIATLRRQVDMLRQYNGDENQSLIKQIELLLVKNQELHERSLNDKDTFHALQRDLQEQLVTLRRNKEKLEEKIMDQYKSMDSRKIKEKQTLMKRAAKALMPKATTRKAIRAPPPAINGSTTEDSSIDETHGGFISPPPPAAVIAGSSSTAVPSAAAPTTSSSSNGHPTTSCSSDVGSSSSPDYESFPLIKSETVVCDNFVLNNRLRARNTILGGSMRLPGPGAGCHPHPSLRNSIRIRPPLQGPPEEDIYSLCGSERGIDVPTPLIPNGSIRHTRSVSNAMSSLSVTTTTTARQSYALSKQASSKSVIKPPPPYPGRVMTPTTSADFHPHDTSTPTPKDPSRSTSTPPAPLKITAKRRTATSYYENVDLPSASPSTTDSTNHSRTGSAVFLEYGCV